MLTRKPGWRRSTSTARKRTFERGIRMNRQILRTLVISNKWLDRCWNSEQHERIYEMAEGAFTVHEIAIAVWLCTAGWELPEIERRMNNLIQTCINVTKGM